MPPPPPSPPYPGSAPSLSTNFTGWNAPKVIDYARKFVVRLTGHPSFPEPWPSWVASPARLTEKCNALEALRLEAESHDKYKIAQRNALTEELKKDLKSSVIHVEQVAQGDVILVLSLGLKIRRTSARKNIPLPLVSPQLTVVQSKDSGSFDGKVFKCPGAKISEVQITDSDPTVEGNWSKVDVFTCQNFQVHGRVPGRSYSLRARCYGRSGTGPWSAIVTLISL